MTKQIAFREVIAHRFDDDVESEIHLALAVGDNKSFRLFQAEYEGIAKTTPHLGSITNQCAPPENIPGSENPGKDGAYMEGGELNWHYADECVEFDDLTDPAIDRWLDEHGWSTLWAREALSVAVARVATYAAQNEPVPYFLDFCDDGNGETVWFWLRQDTLHNSQAFASEQEALDAWNAGVLDFTRPRE